MKDTTGKEIFSQQNSKPRVFKEFSSSVPTKTEEGKRAYSFKAEMKLFFHLQRKCVQKYS